MGHITTLFVGFQGTFPKYDLSYNETVLGRLQNVTYLFRLGKISSGEMYFV